MAEDDITGTGDPYEDDPLERLERNERQGPRALRYVLRSATAIVLLAVIITFFVDLSRDGCPDTVGLCLTAGRVEVVVLPTLLGVILAVTSGITTYRRWKDHIRWRPWLFATYAMWIITTGYLLVSSSAVFAQMG